MIDGSKYVLIFVSKDDPPNIRLEIGFFPHKLFLQMLPRKLERHELMMIAGAARRGKWFVCDGIVSAISRRIIAALAAVCAYRSVTSEIQAEFQAVRMKSAAPIKRMLGAEIVP